jgi:rubredoxin
MNDEVRTWLKSRPLFCMICCNQLHLEHGELFCPLGQAGYAEFAATCIAEGLAEVTTSVEPQVRVATPHTFSCPVCRGAITETVPRMRCSQCGFLAGKGLRHQLVERTPHE